MKFKSVLISALAMASVVACSNDPKDGTPAPDGSKALLKIVMDLPSGTRASGGSFNDGNTSAGDRIQLNSFKVFALDAAGQVISVGDFATPFNMNGTKIEEVVTTKNTASSIYLVGNYTGTLPGVGATLSQLQAALAKQVDILQNGSNTDYLVVAGNGTIGSWTDPGGGAAWTANCAIKPIPVSAKLNITINNKMKNYTGLGNDGQFVIKDISVLYSGKTSSMFANSTNPAGIPYAPLYSTTVYPTDNNTNPYYTSGLATWDAYADDIAATKYYTEVANTNLITAWNVTGDEGGIGGVADQTMLKTFYVYPGVKDGPKTMIVTLRIASDDAQKADKYFSIFLNEDNHMQNIVGDPNKYPSNGRLYQITMNLNVDAGSGGSGNPDPEIPSKAADVTVTIEPVEWTVVSGIEETWN